MCQVKDYQCFDEGGDKLKSFVKSIINNKPVYRESSIPAGTTKGEDFRLASGHCTGQHQHLGLENCKQSKGLYI